MAPHVLKAFLQNPRASHVIFYSFQKLYSDYNAMCEVALTLHSCIPGVRLHSRNFICRVSAPARLYRTLLRLHWTLDQQIAESRPGSSASTCRLDTVASATVIIKNGVATYSLLFCLFVCFVLQTHFFVQCCMSYVSGCNFKICFYFEVKSDVSTLFTFRGV